MFMGCTFGGTAASKFGIRPLLCWRARRAGGLLDDRFELALCAPVGYLAALLVLSTSSDLISRPWEHLRVVTHRFLVLRAAVFTCVAIVGAINAFNMLDGMDDGRTMGLSPWCHSVRH
jgi:UDP-N-acetylmuramyl pentapeptide phosphotransferase/UDP-N-acetylglucosamine-1-phosphate transferase